MNWDKISITKQNGEVVDAQAPIIISASRSTDIPAFYSDWFVQRLEAGYVKWKNPFNGVPLYVSFDKTRLFVFWSKNPKPIIKHLDYFDSKNMNYYFQFTLNDYVKEILEPNVPSVQSRIESFMQLSERIGKNKVIWRFDPLILTDEISVDDLLRKVDNIGSQLKNYTEKLVISFADIKIYRKVQNNLRKNHINYKEFNPGLMKEFASGLQQLNKNWKFDIGTCAEEIDLIEYGIQQNKCIDDDLIIRLFPDDKILMDFLGVKFIPADLVDPPRIVKTRNNDDKGQRKFCGCIISKDIGEYNTCIHLCEYCYANSSKEIALENYRIHKLNPNNEMINK
jgi:DNA repair photolyase